MAGPVDSGRPDDEMLVAYIDGELDADGRRGLEAQLAGDESLRVRLDELRRGGRRFREAFDGLLSAAPNNKLVPMLAKVIGERRQASRASSKPMMAAAAVVLFAVGAISGYLVPRFATEEEPVVAAQEQPRGWRQVVAEYLVLTTGDTLAVIPESPAVLADELAAVGAKLAIDLTPDNLNLPHLYLKRAQLLQFNGRPLAQIAYSTKDAGPIAFCIIANGQADADPAFEVREGSNIVFWTKDGRGYMLIGKLPRETLEQLAGELAARFS